MRVYWKFSFYLERHLAATCSYVLLEYYYYSSVSRETRSFRKKRPGSHYQPSWVGPIIIIWINITAMIISRLINRCYVLNLVNIFHMNGQENRLRKVSKSNQTTPFQCFNVSISLSSLRYHHAFKKNGNYNITTSPCYFQ